MKFTVTERLTLIAALRRASDWSDVEDNGAVHGPEWTRKEREFIRRCNALLVKLKADRKP